MKFVQLIEYNIRNSFLEKHMQSVVEKLFPESFLWNQNQAYLRIKSRFVFIVFQVEYYQNISKPTCKPLAITSYKVFFSKKRGLELVSLLHFLHDFLRKIFFLLYSINWINFTLWLPLVHEILGNMCIVIIC